MAKLDLCGKNRGLGPCCRKTTRHCTHPRIRAYMSVWCFQSDLRGLYPISKQIANAGRNDPNSVSSSEEKPTNGAVELPDMRDVCLAPSRRPFARPQNANYFRRRYARGHAVNLGVAHHAIASDHEYSRLGDAALLPRIINVPLFYEAAFGIAQNWKREPQFAPQGLGSLRRINGNGREVRPGGADLFVVVAVIRQLAKAERSPVSAIENQHQRTA